MRSEWAYAASFASVGLAIKAWILSRSKTGNSKAQADRWAIFVGEWAPTFMHGPRRRAQGRGGLTATRSRTTGTPLLGGFIGGAIFHVSYAKIFSFQGLVTAIVGSLVVLVVYGLIRRRTAA